MQKILIHSLLLGLSVSLLSACSNSSSFSMPWQSRVNAPSAGKTTGPVATGGPVGGHVAIAMDGIDRGKLSHALDNPLGKSTTWTNQQSGTTYTVTPTAKVVLNENPFCRRYTVTAVKGAQTQSSQGTACVGSDSSWQAVSG